MGGWLIGWLVSSFFTITITALGNLHRSFRIPSGGRASENGSENESESLFTAGQGQGQGAAGSTLIFPFGTNAKTSGFIHTIYLLMITSYNQVDFSLSDERASERSTTHHHHFHNSRFKPSNSRELHGRVSLILVITDVSSRSRCSCCCCCLWW